MGVYMRENEYIHFKTTPVNVYTQMSRVKNKTHMCAKKQ